MTYVSERTILLLRYITALKTIIRVNIYINRFGLIVCFLHLDNVVR